MILDCNCPDIEQSFIQFVGGPWSIMCLGKFLIEFLVKLSVG